MSGADEIAARPLVPPRPNLGPEPWPGTDGSNFRIGLDTLAAAVVLAAVAVAWRRLFARKRPVVAEVPAESPVPETYRGRMIGWDQVVRRRLVDRFGPPWAARTTEEIAELSDAIGDDADRLLAFLRASDLAKFSGSEPDLAEDWGPWVGEFLNKEDSPQRTQRGKQRELSSGKSNHGENGDRR